MTSPRGASDRVGVPGDGEALLSPDDLRLVRELFLEEAAVHLAAMTQALGALRADPTDEGARSTLLRRTHTFKGSAGSVALDELAALAHRIEDRVVARGSGPLEANAHAELAAAVEDLRARTRSVEAAVSQATTDDSREHARHGHARHGHATDLRTLLDRLAASLPRLAERSVREIEVRVTSPGEPLHPATVELLADAVLHLLRNAVAHGIEPPGTRELLGKPRCGRIDLSGDRSDADVTVEVRDDGAGIDVDGVRGALVRSGALEPGDAAQLDEAAVVAAIFRPGVSTREDPDDLAGRGVGLDAVADAISRAGGTIRCDSTRGRGCRFTIRVPLPKISKPSR